jgi:hypothetical protein
MQVFTAITALCGIIALSNVNINVVHAEIQFFTADILDPGLGQLKYATYTNTLICGSLFLLTCAGTILHKAIALVVSIVSKDLNTMVLSIVVG